MCRLWLVACSAFCTAVLVAYYWLLCYLCEGVCLLPSMEQLVPSMAVRQPLVGLLHARVPQQQQQQQQHAAISLPLAVWLRAVAWAPLVHRAQASESAALHRASSSGTRSLSWSRCGGSLRAGPGRPWTVRYCPLTRSWLEAKVWGEASGLPMPVQTRWPRWSTLQAPQANPRSALWTDETRPLMAWSMRALSGLHDVAALQLLLGPASSALQGSGTGVWLWHNINSCRKEPVCRMIWLAG